MIFQHYSNAFEKLWCQRESMDTGRQELGVPGVPGGSMAHPDFGKSVNPISTRGCRLCTPQYYLAPQDFQTLLRPWDILMVEGHSRLAWVFLLLIGDFLTPSQFCCIHISMFECEPSFHSIGLWLRSFKRLLGRSKRILFSVKILTRVLQPPENMIHTSSLSMSFSLYKYVFFLAINIV